MARLKSSLQGEEGSDAQSNGDEPVEEANPVLDVDPGAADEGAREAPVDVVPAEEPIPVVPVEVDDLEETPPLAFPVDSPEAPAVPAQIVCPICHSVRTGDSSCCEDCGYYFSENDLVPGGSGAVESSPGGLLQNRFELGALMAERIGVSRFQGLDQSTTPPRKVVILRQARKAAIPQAQPVEPVEVTPDDGAMEVDEEILPSFDDMLLNGPPVTEVLPEQPAWPSLTWEKNLLEGLEHPALPTIIASFEEGAYEYLVEEVPQGVSLWDCWDDPDRTCRQKYKYLAQVAEALHALHQCQTMLEGIRPDIVVIGEDGQARLTDLSDLLPLPLPPNVPLRGSLYTAPELLSNQGKVDARADLYSFGAMLYALHVGRELSDTDFERRGNPKPFIPHFPDCHPAYGRLLTKTFRREPNSRFPTDEAVKEDPTGFMELIRTLNVLGRTLDAVRMEIAAWTNIGIVRTGNEDAYALLHCCESRQDDLGEAALIILCDGMGGYEAGEIAAALTIQNLRKTLVEHPMFAHLAGRSPLPTEVLGIPSVDGHAPEPLDVELCKQVIKEALREANRQVVQVARSGGKRRTMGCTAEVVYIDGRDVVVGHVGDSRTYHLHEGRLLQLTRDQTLVNRLVELGTLTAEEAETHPRRNELQQAIGGQPDVDVCLYHSKMTAGDWVVVCSDGLTGHVKDRDLKEMLQSEAVSAEMAARRLVNLTLIEGATDNVTVVVVRGT